MTNLTFKHAFNLAAPHTWPASIMPCFVGIAVVVVQTGALDLVPAMLCLLISIFMQASVNTFNDYFDYTKGLDSAEDNLDPDDNVLAYYHVKPKQALYLAIAYLIIPFILGMYLIFLKGIIPLVIALFGALIVVLYSGGKTPISYLPIGELVSGFVLGGLVTLGTYAVLAPEFSMIALFYALPTIIGVGLIMQTNNTCDIEKDIEVNRNTMPVKIGRKKSVKLYHALIVLWVSLIVLITGFCFRNGLWVCFVMLLAAYPIIKGLWNNPLLPQSRIAAMGSICSVNVVLGAFYAACIFASILPIL